MRMGEDRSRTGKRIAFYGGSFDPPHRAHLAVAEAARLALELDEVLFAPVGSQPLKAENVSASFEDRVEMTRLAIAGIEGFGLSLADAPRLDGNANYTFDTLTELKRELGKDCTLFCLMGADSLANLRFWHRAAEIPFLAPIIVAARPGEDHSAVSLWLPEGLTLTKSAEWTKNDVAVDEFEVRNAGDERASLFLLPELALETSASRVRETLREDPLTARDELPTAVADYLRLHKLYPSFTGKDATR